LGGLLAWSGAPGFSTSNVRPVTSPPSNTPSAMAASSSSMKPLNSLPARRNAKELQVGVHAATEPLKKNVFA
jgi:hypothetical protein